LHAASDSDDLDSEIDGMLCVALGAAIRASQLEPATAGKPAIERPRPRTTSANARLNRSPSYSSLDDPARAIALTVGGAVP